MFRDQVGVLASWFKGWNECEQTVAAVAAQAWSQTQARFLQLCLEHSAGRLRRAARPRSGANSPGKCAAAAAVRGPSSPPHPQPCFASLGPDPARIAGPWGTKACAPGRQPTLPRGRAARYLRWQLRVLLCQLLRLIPCVLLIAWMIDFLSYSFLEIIKSRSRRVWISGLFSFLLLGNGSLVQ